MKKATADIMPTGDRRNIRTRLKAFRHDPGPLLGAPGPATHRPGDQLHTAVAASVLVSVSMTVLMTVIFLRHRARVSSLRKMLLDADGIGRWDRREFAVPLTIAMQFEGQHFTCC
jgi:hypothetical protein